MKHSNGLVIKAVASKYKVLSGDTVYTCFIRGRIKLDIDVFVGDYVEIADEKGKNAVIVDVKKRKNVLTRPYVANVDKLIIVIAPVPAPDWMLVDKLLINCYAENITPILCLNKRELTDEKVADEYFAPYKEEMKCVAVSCEDNDVGLSSLEKEITDETVCFAGQSAVGKSSIINRLLGRDAMETGELSEKSQRGKNTTRHIEIFPYNGGRVVDTCGFSMMELENVRSDELRLYYADYLDLAVKCRYSGCNHISEPKCAVKTAVEEGRLNKQRYDRYVEIYNKLKEAEDAEY